MLHERCYIAAGDGNLSIRLDDGSVLTTPTGMCKGWLAPEDLVIVDMQGRKLAGERNASSEIAMHLLIYRLRSDVRAVCHAHPPTATGFAAAGMALNQALVSEVVLTLGSIPLAQYGTPGTPELTDALEPLVADHSAILMANHGVVTCADTLTKAYMHMETVEHFAKIALVAHQLGRVRPLDEEQVKKLVARAKEMA